MIFTNPEKRLEGKQSVAKGILEVGASFRYENKIITKHGSEVMKVPFQYVKSKYYIQKVLHSLFPNNFPAFTDAFLHQDYGYLVREFRTGAFTHQLASKELKDIEEKFAKYNITLGLENAGLRENIITDDKTGEEVYLDTLNFTFDSEERIDGLRKLCLDLGKTEEETEDILKSARRSNEVLKSW